MVIPQLLGYDRKNAATLNTNFRKNEEEFIVWTWEKGIKALSTIRVGKTKAMQVGEMYLPEIGNWPSISISISGTI